MKKLNCNVILNLLVIYSSLLLTTSVMRILMAKSFIPQDIDEGLSKMYFYGFLYDNRILSIVILGYLLFFTLFNIGGGYGDVCYQQTNQIIQQTSLHDTF